MTGFWDLSTSMTLNDLEPLKKRFLLNFSQFLDAAHISTLNCDEMAGDRPRHLRKKFSALNLDFSSSSPNPLGSRRPVQAGVKDSYPLKSGYFTAIISCSMNTVADRHRHAAHHNKHWWQAFYCCQRRWPWTFPKGVFSEFFAQFCAVTHISRVNFAKMAGDRPRQPAYEIFSMECRF